MGGGVGTWSPGSYMPRGPGFLRAVGRLFARSKGGKVAVGDGSRRGGSHLEAKLYLCSMCFRLSFSCF